MTQTLRPQFPFGWIFWVESGSLSIVRNIKATMVPRSLAVQLKRINISKFFGLDNMTKYNIINTNYLLQIVHTIP